MISNHTKCCWGWRRVGWRCSRRAGCRPWWCPARVWWRRTAEEFGVGSGLFALVARCPVKTGKQKHTHIHDIAHDSVKAESFHRKRKLTQMGNAITADSKRYSKIGMWKRNKIWEPVIKCYFLVSKSVESAPVRMPGIKNVLCWKTLKNLVYWRKNTHCFFETEVCTHKSERNGDAKPQCQDGHECTKGNSSGGALYPQDQIRQEEVHKHNPAKT